ncbi:PLD nuclease N-terminal domain-containing protein [Cellulomonas chengniuliangii]|uniref:PLD nuclease N-terminal domain-containing protein n=1 Tax=Cellulomonas chengniuliangii TaxID=2968084 RepID=A0ABY5L0I2_9CELL|nr:PLD nuclease N-terminal domain-containing protein [Cellulomonas chengniuliangii]MCC2309540.1 PLD nuclease N-terminal domain-containing protein [Cellulomonas chengniuliangii]UUI74905.1 PLD nuclease N-terminal domain-containing protein [Cellulomonas chengniuliangii]
MRNLLALAAVALIVYTIFDVLRSDEAERFGVHKLIWLAFIVVLPVIGSVAWLVLRQMARSRSAGPARSPGAAAPAPDDDPEFLWRLEQQRRRADREQSREHPDEPRPES